MKSNKALSSLFFVLITAFSVESLADTITQTYKGSVTNNYPLNAVLTQLCPGNGEPYVYKDFPDSTVAPYENGTFHLEATFNTASSTAYKTKATSEPGPCESSFDWGKYFFTYKLYDVNTGQPDEFGRACEFEYNLNGTSCEVYGRAIAPKPDSIIYCKASATYVDPNTCQINFTLSQTP